MRAVALYLAAVLAKTFASLTGLVMVPIAYRLRSKADFTLWYNPEDGYGVPNWYRPGSPFWFRYYVYHALRNPGAGMRNYEWYAPTPEPENTSGTGTILGAEPPPERGRWYWFRANLGPRYGFYATRTFGDKWLDLRIGWKVTPRDAIRLDPKKLRWGHGFTALSITLHDYRD